MTESPTLEGRRYSQLVDNEDVAARLRKLLATTKGRMSEQAFTNRVVVTANLYDSQFILEWEEK